MSNADRTKNMVPRCSRMVSRFLYLTRKPPGYHYIVNSRTNLKVDILQWSIRLWWRPYDFCSDDFNIGEEVTLCGKLLRNQQSSLYKINVLNKRSCMTYQLWNVKPADRNLHGLKQLIIKNLYQFNLGVSICDIHALNNIISFIYHYEEVCWLA